MKTKLVIFFTVMLCLTGYSQSKDDLKTFDPAFTHTVFFWLKEPNNLKARTKFETSLKKFLADSQFAKTNFIGTPPVSTREVVDDSFTYSLIVTFESAEAQEGYQKEEPHLVFIKECKDLWDKVVVYDALELKE